MLANHRSCYFSLLVKTKMVFSFTKEKVLGRGSFGTVYLIRVKSENTESDWATKHLQNGEDSCCVLKEVCIRDEHQRDAARQEGRLLSQLCHVNIIRYFDSFECPISGNLCLVMEYCPGGDVAALIRRRRGIPFHEQQIITWFQQLALALDYLHQRKILHRDIKTGNIFVTADLSVLKLGDFGVAKVLEKTVEMARTCVGTPGYLSPEICVRGQYDSKSDIWSLGCVLYQLMTFRPPFAGRNMNQLLGSIVRGHFAPMPAYYTYELRQTVATMLRKNPEERPSAEALLRKRHFSVKQRTKVTVANRKKISSTPVNLKALGSLAVYATPLLRTPKSTNKCKNYPVKKEKHKKDLPRRRWNPPTQTLIGALSSLCLTDAATFTLSKPRRSLGNFNSIYDESEESLGSDGSDSVNTPTCITGKSETPFHRLERWIVSLEAVHGVKLLKNVSRRLWNAEISDVERLVRDSLFNQISESSVNELVDFFVFEHRLYLGEFSF